jgi:hypothetical protein
MIATQPGKSSRPSHGAGKVLQNRQTVVLQSDDVVDLKGKEVEFLRYSAILTNAACTIPNPLP